MKKYIKLILGNLFILFLLIVLVEVFLHFFIVNTSNQKYLDFASLKQLEKRGLNPIFAPHRYLGYCLSPNYEKDQNRHNSLGFRGEEIPVPKKEGSYRIFCLGGSTTYTSHVKDYKKSYPYLLEEKLKNKGLDVEVINAGVNSWTTYESLINFQLRILDLQPDMIIIYHSINDVRNRMVFPFEAYVADNSGRRAPLVDYRNIWREWLIEKSNILRIICIKNKIVRSKRSILTVDPMADSFIGDDFADQIQAGTYPVGNFEKYTLEKILDNNKPIYFKRNLENLIGLARSYDIDVMLSTFAYSNKKNKKKKENNRVEIKKALREHNKVIKQIALKQNVACLDFDKRITNKNNLFSDLVHLNPKGSAKKAQLFSDFLIANYFDSQEL